MIELREIFEVKYGVNLELNKLTQSSEGINFVSRSGKNNGVSAKVLRIPRVEPIPAGVLSVAGGGSVLETFLQPAPFYSGRDLYYLSAKVDMSDAQKLYYCACLRANKYKYSYGRQANRTLKSILIPSLDELPTWVNEVNLSRYEGVQEAADPRNVIVPIIKNHTTINDLFEIKNGIAATNIKEYDKHFLNCIMYVRPASTQARTLRSYIKKAIIPKENIYPAESLFVSTNGEGSHSFSYVSTHEFVPNSDVAVLIPKEEMSLEVKLYYAKCITANRPLFSYGRKPKGNKLKRIRIPKLSDEEKTEIKEFIRSLPYSSALINNPH